MEFDVLSEGRTVGKCTLQEQGLYWELSCLCEGEFSQIRRLYWNGRCLGVLEQNGKELTLQRRFSKASAPELPHCGRLPTLEPEQQWQGKVLDCQVPSCLRTWKETGSVLSFPFSGDSPCPCLPLLCFFEVKDGQWLLHLDEEERPVFHDFD